MIVALSMLPFDIGLAVLRLFLARGPSAIRRLIVAVVIYTLDGMRRRRFGSHVLNEVCERQPAVTDCDTTPAVSGVVLDPFVEATLLHRKPGSIFLRRGFPRCVPDETVCSAGLSARASTTRTESASKRLSNNLSFRATVAFAQPYSFPVSVVCAPNGGPFSEAFVSQVKVVLKRSIFHLASLAELIRRQFITSKCRKDNYG